jgi:hypothetical protein
MMETAMKVIARGGIDIAEDLAHVALSELSERVTDSEVLQPRPRRRKRTIMRPPPCSSRPLSSARASRSLPSRPRSSAGGR